MSGIDLNTWESIVGILVSICALVGYVKRASLKTLMHQTIGWFEKKLSNKPCIELPGDQGKDWGILKKVLPKSDLDVIENAIHIFVQPGYMFRHLEAGEVVRLYSKGISLSRLFEIYENVDWQYLGRNQDGYHCFQAETRQ